MSLKAAAVLSLCILCVNFTVAPAATSSATQEDIAAWVGSYNQALQSNKPVQDWSNQEWNGYFFTPPDALTFSSNQKEIVWNYKATAYKGINAGLRNDDPELLSRYSSMISELDALMESFKPLPTPIFVYRGQRSVHDLRVGQYCLAKAYTSTSSAVAKTKMFAVGGTLFKIYLSENQKALRMSAVLNTSEFDDREQEFLLPRNSWFQVVEVQRDPSPAALVPMVVTTVFGVEAPNSCELDPASQCCF